MGMAFEFLPPREVVEKTPKPLLANEIPTERLSMLEATTRDQSVCSKQKSCIRRSVTAVLKGLLCFALVLATGAQGQTLRVMLVGTGTPDVSMKRFGGSILVEAGGQKFLFDCGRSELGTDTNSAA